MFQLSNASCGSPLSTRKSPIQGPRKSLSRLKTSTAIGVLLSHARIKKAYLPVGTGVLRVARRPGALNACRPGGHPKSQPWHPPEDPIGLLSLKNITNQYDMQRRNRRTWRGLFDFFLKTSIVNAYLLSTWGGFPPNENSNEEDSLSLKNKTYRKFREDLIESL
jgi:hypothetical protein